MTFGYCINMLAPSGSDGTGRELLPMIGSLGFDYVELPMAQMMAYDEASFEQLFVRPLREAGLPCHCCNNFFPGSIRLTGPEADHAAAVAYAERAMARAEALGAHKIVFGSSGARNYPLGYAREDAMAQMRELLCRLEPLAARHGITLVMEHLNRLEEGVVVPACDHNPVHAPAMGFVKNLLHDVALAVIDDVGGAVLPCGLHAVGTGPHGVQPACAADGSRCHGHQPHRADADDAYRIAELHVRKLHAVKARGHHVREHDAILRGEALGQKRQIAVRLVDVEILAKHAVLKV